MLGKGKLNFRKTQVILKVADPASRRTRHCDKYRSKKNMGPYDLTVFA